MSNPYAYYEDELPAQKAEIDFTDSADSGEGVFYEPRVPIQLQLKRGMFGGRFVLETTRDQCEISGESLPEPIVISRNQAPDQIRVKSNKLIVYTDDRRKHSFRYRGDKYQALTRARLETWAKQRWDDAPGLAYQSVWELLKKNVIYPVLHSMIFLTVLQGAFVLWLILAMTLNTPRFDAELLMIAIVGLLMYAVPPMVTMALAVVLWMRQIWGLYATALLSFFPLIIGIFMLFLPHAVVSTNVIAALFMIIPLAIIGSCFQAMLRYHRQVSRLEHENSTPTTSSGSSGHLFDQNNQITINIK